MRITGHGATPGADSPLPYAGQDAERRAHLGSPFETRGYGHDQGGRRVYRFNSLGFRGPEFDPGARHRVFAFGESHAFGYFVDAEASWPRRFADLWAKAQGLDPAAVCFQNFADVGASNAGIVRSLVTQASAAPPDLVLIHFSDPRRSDVFLGGEPHRVGPWLLEEGARQAALEDETHRERALHQIERARAYYRFALGAEELGDVSLSVEEGATCLEDTLRNILLAQYFCAVHGLAVVATCDLVDALFTEEVRRHPVLGPLAAQVDRQILGDLRIWGVEGDTAEDSGHAGPRRHDRFARALLERYLEGAPAGSGEGPRNPGPPAAAGGGQVRDRVRSFYDALPFNHWRSSRAAARSVRDASVLDAYPDLLRLLDGGEVRRAVDCGCGAGWLSTSLALHHDLDVTALDFSPRSLERARRVAAKAGVAERVRFLERDLLELDPAEVLGLAGVEGFDLAVSLGVLHHTADPRRAFERVSRLVGVGGRLYLGLYHGPGRRPFLEHFRGLVESRGEKAALRELRRLAGSRGGLVADGEHLRSWFRDQVLHPHESQHTLGEVAPWLEDAGFAVRSTSLNRFEPLGSLDEVLALEDGYAERSRRALEEGRFFPGFFTVLAERLGGHAG